ncbi:hypothetical protein [Sphingomonas sp.]|jgi:hypothetical protein|uniref:hypothetical protein n=1 Tax=Sphingomonas sp. TaxID=28214 RepID=UPI002E132D42|nr:hypothetical protein [Sphingomonas sp.]
MLVQPTSVAVGTWVERFLAAVILVGIVYCAIHAAQYGYLPAPFFFVPSDTFADWFNTAFWARRSDAYETWATIYPPLSFVFIRYLGIDRCYPQFRPFDPSAGLAARDCDWLGLVVMGAIFVLNVVLTWKTFRKIDVRTAPMRTICLALGMPMLNGLERGNLLLITYTCVLLAAGPLLSSARLRWFFAGLAINFKVYLVASFVALLLKRRWRWVEGALLATALIYLVTLAMYGAGSPSAILKNIRTFSGGGAGQILDLWHSMTYQHLISILETGSFPLTSIIGSLWVERLLVLLPVLGMITQLLLLLAALGIWLRPGDFTPHRAIALGTLMALVSSEAGMYTQIFFVLFVLMEPWRGFGRIWAIVMCYILAFPFDVPIDRLSETPYDTYFTDSTILISQTISIGPLLRPLMIMSICWALSLSTLNELRRNIYGRGDLKKPYPVTDTD